MDELKHDVKDLLDGSPRATDAPSDVIGTRADTCERHGPYIAHQVMLQLDYKVSVPHWAPCPKCREEWDAANQQEQQRLRQIEMNARMCRTGGREW